MDTPSRLTPLDISAAADGLERAAAALLGEGSAAAAPTAAIAALALRIRAAELRGIGRLLDALPMLPATIQELFARPDDDAVSAPDAFVERGARASLLDLLEMASDRGLSCISTRLYRGWQDRVEARHNARRITTERLGFAIDAGERDALLTALALRNRVFTHAPPVELDPTQLDEALAAVERLNARLRR